VRMKPTAIVRSPKKVKTDDAHGAHVLSMWLLFCKAPGKQTAPGEVVDLGEVGSVRLGDQRLDRDTPYSICRGIR
jgi:hypothetical protein